MSQLCFRKPRAVHPLQEVEAKFEKYGPVREARIVRNPVNGESRGFGFVAMKYEEDVDAVRLLFTIHAVLHVLHKPPGPPTTAASLWTVPAGHSLPGRCRVAGAQAGRGARKEREMRASMVRCTNMADCFEVA